MPVLQRTKGCDKKTCPSRNDRKTGKNNQRQGRRRGGPAQQNNVLHQEANRAHQPPRHCPVLSGPPSLIILVPKRISNGSSVCSPPSSMSRFRLDLDGAGNLGRALAETNEGKSLSNEEYSGFVKSGAVQMRDWGSTSGNVSRGDGLRFWTSVGMLFTETSSGVPGRSPI